MTKIDVKKVLLIGSGPIVIGQAAEFDYSGSQACKAIKEEGIQVVLVNSNPATIQTDLETADVVYLEPLTAKTIEKIIDREKPDGFIATMSGQTGLNLAIELKGVLEKHGVKVLGTSVETIQLAEDREAFRDLMVEIGEPVPQSERVKNIGELKAAIERISLPVILRPDFCLGGKGTMMVRKPTEVEEKAKTCFAASGSGELLVEKSVEGLSELEYEVIRDSKGNCITVCNMENLDAMGVHTGESVVVAPSQTLSDVDYQRLRTAAIKIIRALQVQGACNVQFALNQETGDYWVIEVNPRTSRSSALASKATGYPIARVATKIALGYALPEIENKITGKSACFEPALDYVVVKIPRWPFDKLRLKDDIGTSMKSTGETMAIGRTFQEALGKAFRSLEVRFPNTLDDDASRPSSLRVLKLREFLKSKTVSDVGKASKINEWFLEKINLRTAVEDELRKNGLSKELLLKAKKEGFTDSWISQITGFSVENIRLQREKEGIKPIFKMVDTCAAEFEALTPYYYSTYESENEAVATSGKKKIIILGSGPIRIGQGIEFDYCTVHAVRALKEVGFEAIIINNNPETVSTDFDISSRLYFEPLHLEDVLAIIKNEGDIEGVMVQFGGQTAINLALPLHALGINVLGTAVSAIDATEDRKKFKKLTRSLGIPIVESGLAYSKEEAVEISRYIGYPLLIRPSYVLGGRAMEIVRSESEMLGRVDEAIAVCDGHPLLLDHFLEDGVEIDVDAVGDGERVMIAGIMEQLDEAGVHSGDSSCVLPVQSVSQKALEKIRDYTVKLGLALKIRGLFNIQMAVKGDSVFVLEVNPRASRTVPFVSKATGIPIAKLAAKIQAGAATLEGMPAELIAKKIAVKVPVFPFNRFPDLDPVVSPEMKSTGETMGFGDSFEQAFCKAMLAAGHSFGSLAFVGNCGKWRKTIESGLKNAGVEIISDELVAFEKIASKELSFAISIPNGHDESKLRKACIAHGVSCFTSAFAALNISRCLKTLNSDLPVVSLNEVCSLNQPVQNIVGG
ncbi:MAG: carbamoyl-phosphate synthase large subunit [Candidatus Micrarchaeota archaeon]